MSVEVQLVEQPIDADAIQGHLQDPDVGAQVWFHGVTRRTTHQGGQERVTETLFYEAHAAMAVVEMRRIAEAAIERFQIAHVVIVHRLGEVPIGQASVVLGCSSAHRRAALEAVAWIMDALKQDVPIWKQERFAGGETQWVHPGR